MNKETIILPASILMFTACQNQQKQITEPQKPNIVYVLADDLGYGDLSCYGQIHFQTPNIDQLAKEGMTFTQHYAGSTVCAPSRSVLLTGQHTGHTPIRGNKRDGERGNWPLPSNALTLAKILKGNGYITGAFGKWGLGSTGTEGDPNNQGFDEFFGYHDQNLAHHYYPYHLWHNKNQIILEGNQGKQKSQYAPDMIHEQALRFIEKNSEQPFFLYYSSLIPHADMDAPELYMNRYRGKFDPEPAYTGVDDGERFRKGPYISQSEPRASFAAMINVLDDQVGEIIVTLKKLGIEDNTIVLFSSDNGPHMEGGADPDYFDSNGFFRGHKRDLYEGGIRVPMLVRWPGKIKAASKTNHISAFWDVLPTIADIINAPTPDNIDGISFLPTLLGKKNQKQHDYLYWEFHEKNGRLAIRQGDWKLVRYNVFNPFKITTELYNLINDPGEIHNVAEDNPEITSKLLKLLELARTPSENFPFEKKYSEN